MPSGRSDRSYRQLLALHEDVLDRFEDAWVAGTRLAIEELVSTSDPADRLPLLVELVHIDLERRITLGEPVRVETYFSRFPELVISADTAVELISTEYSLRRKVDAAVLPGEYVERFPRWRDAVQKALRDDAEETLSLRRGNPSDASGRDSTDDATLPGPVTWHPLTESSTAEFPRQFGAYLVLEEIARGGMGVVYKARQASLKRVVALKMIRGFSEGEALLRFRREAEAVAQLQHAHIVQVFETGEQGGCAYFAMEYCNGGSLAERLKESRPSVVEAANLIAKLADASEQAHAQGVVHRDLKPANVLLAGSRSSPLEKCVPKISDFGLAKQLDDDSSQTRTGEILGTPCYMSPEQATGKVHEIGPATDVYSLGAILYELLTGQPPFRGATTLETVEQVRSREPVSPRKLNRRVPRDLETICLKCLQKQPAKRYATATELADDLRRFIAQEPIVARPIGLAERAARWARRRPATVLAGALAILLLLAGAIGERIWRLKQAADEAAANAAAAQEQHVEYFAQFSRKRGEPVGIGSVTEEEAYTLPRAFRFVRKGNIVDRVELVNAVFLEDDNLNFTSLVGLPRRFINAHREAKRQFIRNDQGQVLKEEVFDPSGQLLWSLEYSGLDSALFMDRRGKLLRVEILGTRVPMRLAWDQHGWLREFQFIDEHGDPVPGPDGTFGARLTHSKSGLITKLEQLGRQGELVSSEGGPPIWKMNYDEHARLIGTSFFDNQEQPTHSETYHCWQRVYKEGGYETSFHLLDGYAFQVSVQGNGTGQKEIVKKVGRPGVGEIVHQSLDLGPENDGRRLWLEERYFLPTHRKRYSEQGRIAEAWVRHAPGSAKHSLESSATRVVLDQKGSLVEVTNLDRHAQPIFDPTDGFTRMRYLYDEGGSVVESIWERQDDLGNWATIKKANSALNWTEIAKYTAQGKAIADESGVHRRVFTYDARQNRIDERFFGIDGRPVNHTEIGVHRLASEYDVHGRRVARKGFDIDGRPAVSIDNGTHRWADRLDDNGRLLERIYFGVDDRPTVCKAGFAKQTQSYLASGETREKSFWIVDEAGKFALSKREDGRGRILEEAFFTSTGARSNNRFGYHRVQTHYDGDSSIELAFFDGNGEPTRHSNSGSYGWIDSFDASGRGIQGIVLDAQRKPMNNRDGHAKWQAVFDATGQLQEKSYWVVTPQGEFVLKRREDGKGRPLEEVALSPIGEPQKFDYGVHRILRRYVDTENYVEASVFGIDGNPVIHQFSDCYGWADTFDAAGRLLQVVYLDAQRKPMNSKFGIAKQRNILDVGGQLLEKESWVINPDGVFILNKREDAQGRILEETALSAAGERRLFFNGYHRVLNRYDAGKEPVEVSFFGTDGAPVVNSNSGSYGWTDTFDAAGRKIQGIDLDAQRKPMNNRYGFAKWKAVLNDAGQMQEKIFWTVNASGEFVFKRREDGDGRILETADFSGGGSTERFSQNLAYRPPKSVFPKATASHTSPYDKEERANDGIVLYELSAFNRWTSYLSTNHTDWLEVEFENDTAFSHVDLAIYDEGPRGGVQTPRSYVVETWDGKRWLEIPNQKRSPESPKGNQWNEVRFGKVTARKVRVVFTHAGQARSGITEIAIWP